MDKNLYFSRNLSTGKLEVKEFTTEASLALLRVADPILSNIAQGYPVPKSFIGDKIFPSVRTEKETGRFPAFGSEAFRIPSNLKRAPGSVVQQMIVQNGYVTASLSEYALGFGLDRRELNEFAGTPDQLVTMRQNMVSTQLAIYREYLQAKLATTSSSYSSSGSGASLAWGSSGDPVVDMRTAVLAVRKAAYGIDTNMMVAFFSPAAWELFINNAQVLQRIKYQGSPASPAQITENAAAQLLQVSAVYVGYAVSGTGSGGGPKQAAMTPSFLWDSAGTTSSNAGVVVVGQGWGVPAFGYTYERVNSPIVESWYDNATKSQRYDSEHFFDPAVTLNTAGYLYYGIA